MPRLFPILQFVRAPLVFTALADSLAAQLLRGDLPWRATPLALAPGRACTSMECRERPRGFSPGCGCGTNRPLPAGTLSVEAARAIVAALAEAAGVWVRVCGEHSLLGIAGNSVGGVCDDHVYNVVGSILFPLAFWSLGLARGLSRSIFWGIRCSALLPHHLRIRLARVNGRVHA